mmetsp:Transcript_24576/g.56744  ORF Transcript_24576/g.56744 Transcript_24576/m.56744 type:complete len:92 (+) Transcript_24576:1141-1416(+)
MADTSLTLAAMAELEIGLRGAVVSTAADAADAEPITGVVSMGVAVAAMGVAELAPAGGTALGLGYCGPELATVAGEAPTGRRRLAFAVVEG